MTDRLLYTAAQNFKDKHGVEAPRICIVENKMLPENCIGIRAEDGRWGWINKETCSMVLCENTTFKMTEPIGSGENGT